MSSIRSPMTWVIASAVLIGSSKRRSTRGSSNGTTGTIGSATSPRAWSSRVTVVMPSRRASGPRAIG